MTHPCVFFPFHEATSTSGVVGGVDEDLYIDLGGSQPPPGALRDELDSSLSVLATAGIAALKEMRGEARRR
jgi:hypothetical protein